MILSVVKPFTSLSCFVQVFISIAIILGDGIYNLVKIILITAREMWKASSKQTSLPVVTENLGE